MTNREKLNAMSNEELADTVGFYCRFCPCYGRLDCAGELCKLHFLEWLEIEVDE